MKMDMVKIMKRENRRGGRREAVREDGRGYYRAATPALLPLIDLFYIFRFAVVRVPVCVKSSYNGAAAAGWANEARRGVVRPRPPRQASNGSSMSSEREHPVGWPAIRPGSPPGIDLLEPRSVGPLIDS